MSPKPTLGCACCGYLTVTEDYDICAICSWNRDRQQECDPDSGTGPNGGETLREAQERWARRLGRKASEPYFGTPVPQDPSWRPLLQLDQFNVVGLRNVVLDAAADPRDRVDAVRLIGQLADVDSVAVVIRQLDDENASMKKAAIRALSYIPDERARSALRQQLSTPALDAELLAILVEAVGRQRDVEAVPLLVNVAKAPVGRARARIASELSRIGRASAYVAAKQVFDLTEEGWRVEAAVMMKANLIDRLDSANTADNAAASELLAYILNWTVP